ncbi:MAG: hypothetical protein FWG61_04785 [Firmicutes bacterium]|nr:hypothetical protein [Bacillota bacterium]
MFDFYIYSGIGLCLTALLIFLFFKTAGKTRKQQLLDREMIATLGDEGLLRLYDQAESDTERDGIIEFVKEKLTSEEPANPVAINIMPAGTLGEGEITPPEKETAELIIMPPEAAEAVDQDDKDASLPQASPAAITHNTDDMKQDSAEPPQASIAANNRRQVPGMLTAEPKEEEKDSINDTSHTQTYKLPMDKMDWAAVEEALEKKREEYARIMAHNQLIQSVFSKIQGVENRVVGELQKNEEQINKH